MLALALSHNRDLKIARADIEKARAPIRRAARRPTAHHRRQQPSQHRSRTGTGNAAITSSQFNAQIGFTSYRLDLWRRVRSLSDAALQQFLQTTVNQRSGEIALLADVPTHG